MRRALVIVGKAPRPGRSKTRLVPPLSHEDAARLSGAFLADTVAIGLSLGWERVSVVHPADPDEGVLLAAHLPAAARLSAQQGIGLGAALRDAFARHLAEGFERVVLIGSDNPSLPASHVEEACAALDTHDLTIGPTSDGGYYLLGMRRLWPRVFEGIDWSTSRVCAQTLARAAELGLRVHQARPWYDVDSVADLQQLQAELGRAPEHVAPHTRNALAMPAVRDIACAQNTVSANQAAPPPGESRDPNAQPHAQRAQPLHR
jgi:rSAM/selenodomain-associated transferase 1